MLFNNNIISYFTHYTTNGNATDYGTDGTDCDFLLLQEHWLYKSEFPKLLFLGSSTDMTAVSAMDESIHRVGRPFGGCAIVWRASITGQITKIDSDCNRLCAIMYTCNNTSILLLNCYMPCDNSTDDTEYIDILNSISQLMYTYDPSHVIIGGDLNVDFSRSGYNKRILLDFINDFNLFTCIDLPYATVPFTYINHNNSTSKIDHFLATDSLKDKVSNCSIIDNHLYSDHVPICIEFNINVTHVQEEIRPYTTKQAWYKASEQDLSIYKDRLDELLTDITVDDSLLHCRDMFCLKHKEKISELYSTVITSCINASDHIPTTSKRSGKVKPGWNDNV